MVWDLFAIPNISGKNNNACIFCGTGGDLMGKSGAVMGDVATVPLFETFDFFSKWLEFIVFLE